MNKRSAGVDLYWLPLGTGGNFVRFNGRVYEAIEARREHREPLDLYHTALEITVPEGRFVIENAWPILDADGPTRGVAVEGPVGSRHLARFRVFRYEIRCWRDGIIADVSQAVASPQRISDDSCFARRILGLVASVPPLVWGRRPQNADEMWNSNSVISWLLARSGLRPEEIHPSAGGRAPGWAAGLRLANRNSSKSQVPDGGAGIAFRSDVGAEAPALGAVAVGLLAIAGVLLAAAIALISGGVARGVRPAAQVTDGGGQGNGRGTR